MKKSLVALLFFAGTAIFSLARESQSVPETQNEDALLQAAIDSLPTIYETRTRVFTVLSEDVAQMRRVSSVAKKIEGHLSTVLGWNLVAEGAKLSVWVAPDPDTKLIFESSRDFRQNATCTFFADTTKLSDYAVAFGLAQTVLRQYGSEFDLAFENMQAPLWAASALATETAITHNSGRLLLLRERSKKTAPLPLKKLVEPRCSHQPTNLPDEDFQISAFWFYRVLRRRELASWKKFPDFFREILKNPDGAFPQKKDAARDAADLAWATAFFSAIDKTPSGTESLADSQMRFTQSRRFLLQIGETEQVVDSAQLIGYRHLLGVKKLAYIRLRELNEMLSVTNPVWHNAFVELGVFLEMIVMREDTSGELREGSSVWAPERGTRDKIETGALLEQWARVDTALREATQLHTEIRALLSEKPKQ